MEKNNKVSRKDFLKFIASSVTLVALSRVSGIMEGKGLLNLNNKDDQSYGAVSYGGKKRG